MPYRDQVLGGDLDLRAVGADAADQARGLFEQAGSNDRDLSASDRQRVCEQLIAIPGVAFVLAIEGEELARSLLVGTAGALRWFPIRESRAADRDEPPHGRRLPELELRGDVDIDEVVGLLRAGGTDDIEELDETSFTMPDRWDDLDRMISTLAAVRPRLRTTIEALVEIDGRRFDVRADAKRVTCRELYVIADDPEHARRFRTLVGVPEPGADVDRPVARAAPQRKPPPYDAERPLVSGTCQQRISALAQVRLGRAPFVAAALLAAARDPANADPRYADVRRELYRVLAPHDRAEVGDGFLHALREETDDVAESAIYFAWRQTALVERLPALLDEAVAAGDERLAARLRRALAGAR